MAEAASPVTIIDALPAAAFGMFLALIGLGILYSYHRQRPGDEVPPGREKATGRIVRDWFEAGVVMATGIGSLQPHGTTPPTAWMEYEFEALGRTHRAKEAVNESVVMRVDGLTRRLGSLSAGDEVPVWYRRGDPSDCTVMPTAIVGRLLPSEVGWGLVVIGVALVGVSMWPS